jgi:general secretion pathway protein K
LTRRAATALRRHRPPGFALLLVLVTLVLLSAVALHLSATGRTEAQIAFNLLANAKAEALADAGVERAVFALVDADATRRWAPDAPPHELRLAGGTALIELHDENAQINPNRAPEGLIGALLRVVGVDQAGARRIAVALGERRRRGGPLETIDELAGLADMTPQILEAIRPHLSLVSLAVVPDPGPASPPVRQAVDLYRDRGVPSQARPGASARVIGVRVVAMTEDGAAFRREAVVRLESESARGFAVLVWRQGMLP